MSVITISRGSYSHGKEIAEKVAHKLGYDCISRDILIEASKEFNVPEIKLFQAIYDTSNIMDRIFGKKERYITYIQAALLKSLMKDNMVYHGFAGHFFVKEIPHVLKVRILADMEERIQIMMERNGISRKDAVDFIHKLDRQRRKWSRKLYGIDTADPSLYDLVIHVDTIKVDTAVDIICFKVGSKRFQTTPESLQKIQDLSVAAEAKARLMDLDLNVKVKAQNGSIQVSSRTSAVRKPKLEAEVRQITKAMPGITDLKVNTVPATTGLDDDRRCEILIVDDEAVVCDRLKAFLDKDGHRVETRVDPAEALRLLGERDFDIVISDIRMGEIDGIQIMDRVLKRSQRTKVVMITGYATLDLARETLTKGAFDFIAKPFKAKEIRATIKRAAEALEQDVQHRVHAVGV